MRSSWTGMGSARSTCPGPSLRFGGMSRWSSCPNLPVSTSVRPSGQAAAASPGCVLHTVHVDESHVESDLKATLVTEEQIQHRLRELAAEIERDYQGRDLLLVGVLKG